MCGIIGHIALDGGLPDISGTEEGVAKLRHRGPDNRAVFNKGPFSLGHARLAVLDVSAASHQPFEDASGRYVLTFNGEIYNYRELRSELETQGVHFRTSSDTEVLLHLLIEHGSDALHKLNGFFAFCFCDTQERYTLIARDRLGIKPLYYHKNPTDLQFCSELKPLLTYDIPKELDPTGLNLYFQLNYIPAPLTAIKGVKKLKPGHLLEIRDGNVKEIPYYEIPWNGTYDDINYDDAQEQLRELLISSVRSRMVSDVALGCFLSGGIDSSIISSVAAQQTDRLQTFSIGYADNPFFDETSYAELVARNLKTSHTTFKVSTAEILGQLPAVLDHLDEPFADSSAIAVHLLSERTKKKVTVALSGDGADELFSGYNKHAAEWVVRNKKLQSLIARTGKPLWSIMPASRDSKVSNIFRKMHRFAEGASLSPPHRYWRWASILSVENAQRMLHPSLRLSTEDVMESYTNRIVGGNDLNDMLFADCSLILPNDMLAKVDKMSMAHGLEVRTPFLDHQVVEFAFSIPSSFKIDGSGRKRILRDTFREVLPAELYQRPKKGFEVPLLSWMTGELADQIVERYLSIDHGPLQRILSEEATVKLRSRLFSSDPGDSHATVWAIMVLDHWLDDIMT